MGSVQDKRAKVEPARAEVRVQGYVRHLITGAGVANAIVTLADAADHPLATTETMENHHRTGYYEIKLDRSVLGVHRIDVAKPGLLGASRRVELTGSGQYDVSFSVV